MQDLAECINSIINVVGICLPDIAYVKHLKSNQVVLSVCWCWLKCSLL